MAAAAAGWRGRANRRALSSLTTLIVPIVVGRGLRIPRASASREAVATGVPRRNPHSTHLSFECDYVAPLNRSHNRFSRTTQPKTAAPSPQTAAPKNPPIFHLSAAAEGNERHITTPRQGDSQRRRALSTLDPYGEREKQPVNTPPTTRAARRLAATSLRLCARPSVCAATLRSSICGALTRRLTYRGECRRAIDRAHRVPLEPRSQSRAGGRATHHYKH